MAAAGEIIADGLLAASATWIWRVWWLMLCGKRPSWILLSYCLGNEIWKATVAIALFMPQLKRYQGLAA